MYVRSENSIKNRAQRNRKERMKIPVENLGPKKTSMEFKYQKNQEREIKKKSTIIGHVVTVFH